MAAGGRRRARGRAQGGYGSTSLDLSVRGCGRTPCLIARQGLGRRVALTLVVVVVIVVVLVAVQVDRVEHRADDRRVNVPERAKALSAHVLARLERADDEHDPVDEGRDD